MKKSKKEESIIERIRKIHTDIRSIVIDSGIQEPQFNFAIKNIEKESEEYQIILLAWFINFRDNEYKIVEDTIRQFSGWDYYKTTGINHFPEQILLRRRQKALREAWHSRPRPKRIQKILKEVIDRLENDEIID